MPPRCKVCASLAKDAIEEAIRFRIPSREIAARFGVGRMSVRRHAKNHMNGTDRPTKLVPVSQVENGEIEALGLTGTPRERMDGLITKATVILARAERQASLDTQIRALAELRKVVELMEKVAGRMPPETAVPILVVNMPHD